MEIFHFSVRLFLSDLVEMYKLGHFQPDTDEVLILVANLSTECQFCVCTN